MAGALLILTACNSRTGAEAGFARAALERNPQLEVVAYDANANTFTVRVRQTGDLQVVRSDEIVGTVPGGTGKVPSSPAQSSPAQPAAPASAEQGTQPEQLAANEGAAAGESAQPPEEAKNPVGSPRAAADTSRGTGVIRNAETGAVLASSQRADTAVEAAKGGAATDAGESSPTPQGAASSRESADRKVLASGPGYSIVAGEPAAASVRLASTSSDIPSPVRGVAVERRSEPMICQGARLLHIDGRNLQFDGDAVSAEDGCEIHITNSHIIAGGVGVTARAANVHIKNSVIEGKSGSVSASDGANVYTQSSTFRGLSRRLDTATFHDLGGTVWN
ncbi:MAG: hypothetical protein IRZ28_15920 [Steroidobacteraceae bacterium]|nr:hypothetical protein [Steroidobacteraceae bacterium]